MLRNIVIHHRSRQEFNSIPLFRAPQILSRITKIGGTGIRLGYQDFIEIWSQFLKYSITPISSYWYHIIMLLPKTTLTTCFLIIMSELVIVDTYLRVYREWNYFEMIKINVFDGLPDF